MASKRTDNQEPMSYQALLDENHSLQRELNILRTRLREAEEFGHAEEKLRESKDKYGTFFENSSDAILLALVNGTVYKANPAACRIFGMTEEEIIQTGRNGLVDTLDPRLELALEEVGRTGRFKGELNHRRKDGTIFPGEIWTEIFKDKNSSLKVFIIIRDITEQKLKEDTLRKTEERYRTLFMNMTEGFLLAEVICNKDGKPYDYRYLEINPAFELNTGMKREQLLGRTVLEVFPDVNHKLVEKYLEIAFTDKAKHFEVFSQTFHKHLDVYVFSPERGKIAIIFRDITERKQMEEKTRQRAEEIETVMEVVPAAIWIAHDTQSHNITGNRMANEIYEAKTGENVSANITPVRRFFQKGHELAADELPIQKATQKDIDVSNEELDVLLPSGEWVAILGSASPLHDINGNVRGGVAAFMDVTQRKKAEAKLKETLDNLEELVKQRTEELEKAYDSLKESDGRLKALFKLLPVGVYIIDKDRNILDINLALEKILGLSPSDLIKGKSAARKYLKSDGMEMPFEDFPYVRSLKHKGSIQSSEMGIVKEDGSTIWIDVNATYLPVSDGQVVITARDITERKQEEHRIHRYNSVLMGINRIFGGVVRAEKERDLGNACLSIALGITGSQIGFIVEVDKDGIMHNIAISERGMDQGLMDGRKGHPRFLGDSILHGSYDRVIDTGKSFFTNNPWSYPDIDLPQDHPALKSLLVVPLIQEGKTTGMIAVANREGGYSSEQQEDLEAIAPAVTQALWRKKAEEILAKMSTARQKEIHHRIKNNLQVISSLLDLQVEKFKNKNHLESAEVIEAFKESQNRVMSIAFIHKELHEGGGLEKLNFSLYLEKLAENLFQTYRVGHSDISLDLDLEDSVFFDIDVAVPLGLIVNELISNSFKYAFPSRNKGTIRVKLLSERVIKEPNNKEELKRKYTKYTLIVADNGIGIPDNINLENTDTLGLQLVSILVDQLDGKIKVGRDQGTEFNISFNTCNNGD